MVLCVTGCIAGVALPRVLPVGGIPRGGRHASRSGAPRAHAAKRAAAANLDASRQQTQAFPSLAAASFGSDRGGGEERTRCRAMPLGGGGAGPGIRSASVETPGAVKDAVAAAEEPLGTTKKPFMVRTPPRSRTQTVKTKRSQQMAPPKVHLAPESVTLVNEDVRLWMTTDGRLNLHRLRVKRGAAQPATPTDHVVARSHVQLPPEADGLPGVITSTTSDDDGNLVAAVIRWGNVARLRVESTAMVRWRARRGNLNSPYSLVRLEGMTSCCLEEKKTYTRVHLPALTHD